MNARRLVISHGRHDVVEERLTDGSRVYSVVTPSDDGPEIVFACGSFNHANSLAQTMQIYCVDISVRDREGVL